MSRAKPKPESVAEPPAPDAPAVEVVPIDAILPDASNVRTRDAETERMLVSSLKQFGPGRSIVLASNDVVKAGNGTLKAAREAGFDEVLKVRPKPGQLVAVVRDDWSPTEATAYAIADNRLTDKSSFDPDALAEQLHSLREEGFDFEPMGFTMAEAGGYVGDTASFGDGGPTAGDDEAPPEDFPEKDEDIETEYCCPKCGYQWSGKRA